MSYNQSNPANADEDIFSSCGLFFNRLIWGFVASVGLAISAIAILLYLMTSRPASWTMAITIPAVFGVVTSFVMLLFGNWLIPILKAILTIPAALALAYWDLPLWADLVLSAYIVVLVVAVPIAFGALDWIEEAVSITTLISLLVSFAIYGLKLLFEWVYIVGLVIVIVLLAIGFLFSLWSVCKAQRRGTAPWRIGWTGMIVSVAGIALALSGYTVRDALVLLPPW